MELEETGLRIQPSQLGGAGIFATRSFKPGDQAHFLDASCQTLDASVELLGVYREACGTSGA